MIGTTLSHYSIEAELGRGGMGIVYKAKDTTLERTVAIKVLPQSALSNEDDKARFFREAKAAAALNHPNIAVVYEVGEGRPNDTGDVHPFIAMEFISGSTIEELIRKGPIPLDEAIKLAREIADGLCAAHQNDVVHRDIKAANVMLDSQGRAKILDFGLALTNQSTKLTRMGSTLGTVAYMSPEQARGELVDHRTDIWALGVLIHEMVTGQNPFRGDYEQAIIYSVLNEESQPLTALRTGVPMGLEWIVNKCLSKAKESRYASAADLIVDLDSVEGLSRRLSTLSSGPRSALAPQNAGSRPSWFKTPVIVAAAVLAVAIGIVGGNTLLNFGAHEIQQPYTLPIQLQGVSSVIDAALSPDGRTALLLVQNGSGVSGVELWSLETGELTSLEESGYYFTPRISPDGSTAFYTSLSGGLISVRVADGSRTVLYPDHYFGMQDRRGRLLSSGSQLFSGTKNSGIYLTDLNGGIDSLIVVPNAELGHAGLFVLQTFEDRDEFIAYGAFGGDEPRDIVWVQPTTGTYTVLTRYAEYVGIDKENFLYYKKGSQGRTGLVSAQKLNMSSGELTGDPRQIATGANDMDKYRISREGTLIAITNEITEYQLSWLSLDGHLQSPIKSDPNVNANPVISPNGKLFAAEMFGRDHEGSYLVNIYSLEDGSPLQVYEGEVGRDPAWSPDGRYLYLTPDQGSSAGMIRVRTDGSNKIEEIALPHEFVQEAAPSPDGKSVTYMALNEKGEYNLYEHNFESRDDRTIAESESSLNDPVYSPNGQFIAYERTIGSGVFGEGQSIRVREVSGDGDWLISEDVASPRFWDPMWSPDGPDGRYIYFRNQTTLFRRKIQLEPSFRPLGNVEEVTVLSGNFGFNFAISPADGRILVRYPRQDSDVERPDAILALNWVDSWKRKAGLK